LVLVIGLRYRVGCDWFSYIIILHKASRGFLAALGAADPAYGVINLLSNRMGLWIWGTNLACAAIFVFGLVRLARLQPNPPLAIVVAIPYLVIVVAMGYTRQSAALGLEMLAISYFVKQQYVKMTVSMLFAAAFHKTSIFVFPLLGMAMSGSSLVGLIGYSALTFVLYEVFLKSDMNDLMLNYVYAEYSSSGALIRLLMNFVPALLFITFLRRWNMAKPEKRLWLIFSLCSLAAIVGYLLSPSSTAVDRLALYLIPLQVAVLSRMPVLMGRDGRQAMMGISFVLIYVMAVEVVWLNFATNAICWVPYQSIFQMNPAANS
jgi:hypothetical protein